MASFFNFYPKTFYTSGANNVTSLDTVTNIIARFGFEAELKENSSAFYPYQIKDSDTPEIIASKYYDNPERHWMVLLFNDIIDPQYDWPLPHSTFIQYVSNKYAANGAADSPAMTGLAWAQSRAHPQSFYKIITRTQQSSSINSRVLTETIQIDEATFTALPVTTATYTLNSGTKITENITKNVKTHYEYEEDLNEAKRNIRLLKNDFASAVDKEFRKVISQ
jgi:hypothetical protein